MPISARTSFLAFIALLPLSAFSAEGNVAKGRRAFTNQCAACHGLTAEHRPTGPGLLGIAGRKAGTAPGFAFTEAMKKSNLTWEAATLDKYLANPSALVPGTTMVISVPAPAARADLIAFLNTLTPTPAASPAPAPAK